MNYSAFILKILHSNLSIFLSWGVSKTVPIHNGIKIHVNGLLHTGWVNITYNEGADLFDIDIVDNDGDVLKTIEEVYIDSLVDIIDGLVERTPNYEEDIKKHFEK